MRAFCLVVLFVASVTGQIFNSPFSFSTTPSDLLTSLVGFWTLDEVSGARLDSSGNGSTLTDNNTVASTTGKIGLAAVFQAGVSEFLSRSDNAFLSAGINTSFTIDGWVYPTD